MNFSFQSIKKRLEELDQQTLAIDAHVLLASKATPLADEEVCCHVIRPVKPAGMFYYCALPTPLCVCIQQSLDSNKSDELMIYCATCGQPQPLRAALTHFEKCYSKVYLPHLCTFCYPVAVL